MAKCDQIWKEILGKKFFDDMENDRESAMQGKTCEQTFTDQLGEAGTDKEPLSLEAHSSVW